MEKVHTCSRGCHGMRHTYSTPRVSILKPGRGCFTSPRQSVSVWACHGLPADLSSILERSRPRGRRRGIFGCSEFDARFCPALGAAPPSLVVEFRVLTQCVVCVFCGERWKNHRIWPYSNQCPSAAIGIKSYSTHLSRETVVGVRGRVLTSMSVHRAKARVRGACCENRRSDALPVIPLAFCCYIFGSWVEKGNHANTYVSYPRSDLSCVYLRSSSIGVHRATI